MNYAVVIFPSKKIQDEANAYRKRYDSKYTLIPPHIKLKAPFPLDEAKRGNLSKELSKIAKQVEPFPITISKVRSFVPVTYTIFFKVEPNESLTKLNDFMYSEPFPTERTHPFVPHITIGQDLMEDEFSDIYESLRMKDVYFEDTVDRFHLCYELENGSWSVYETFLLGQE